MHLHEQLFLANINNSFRQTNDRVFCSSWMAQRCEIFAAAASFCAYTTQHTIFIFILFVHSSRICAWNGKTIGHCHDTQYVRRKNMCTVKIWHGFSCVCLYSHHSRATNANDIGTAAEKKIIQQLMMRVNCCATSNPKAKIEQILVLFFLFFRSFRYEFGAQR